MKENTIHTRIRAARERKGFTQQDVATALDVSYQAVQQWECEPTGLQGSKAKSTTPRGKRIEALAKLLGVTKSWLMFGDEKPEDNILILRPGCEDTWAKQIAESGKIDTIKLAALLLQYVTKK